MKRQIQSPSADPPSSSRLAETDHTTLGRNRTVLLVLNYKKYSDSVNFLQSLVNTGLNDADIVILDNASGNDSVPELRHWIEAHFPCDGADILDTDKRTIGKPESAVLGQLFGRAQPLTLPQTFNPPIVVLPASISKQSCYRAINIATILACQIDPSRHTQLATASVLIGGAPRRDRLDKARAQKFHFGTFERKRLYNVRSEMAHLSRSFSFFEPLWLFKLVGSHAANLLSQAIECLLVKLHLADDIHACHSLYAKHRNLPQLGDKLFRLVSLDS